jgi:hypothetical protein
LVIDRADGEIRLELKDVNWGALNGSCLVEGQIVVQIVTTYCSVDLTGGYTDTLSER